MTQYRDLPNLLPDPLKRVQHRLVMAKLVLAIQSLSNDTFTIHDLIPLVRIGNRRLLSKYLLYLYREGYLSLAGKANYRRLSVYSRREKIFTVFDVGRPDCCGKDRLG